MSSIILLPFNQTATLSVMDRAMQYGDGCFSTILVDNAEPRLWKRHRARFESSLARLSITFNDWAELETVVFKLATSTQNLAQRSVIKILFSRGSGGRGYSPMGCQQTQVVVTQAQWPERYSEWKTKGIELGVCEQRLSISPMLAGMKHLNRLEQVLVKAETESKGYLDSVVLDANGHICETTVANIFWRCGKTLYTPYLKDSGVHGVMRAEVINTAIHCGYDVELVDMGLSVLWDAEEIFITNALMELVPINRIQQRTYQNFQALEALSKRLYLC